MGNGVTKVGNCFASAGEISRRHDIVVYLGDSLHEGLGTSFCYFPPEPAGLSNSKIHSEETTTFRSISGASVSANASTPSSTALVDVCQYSSVLDRASNFESSELFASVPLQPVPRGQPQSGSGVLLPRSSPIERGFLSGPIERGFLSGPIDRGLYSGPFEKENGKQSVMLQRSLSHGDSVIDEFEVKPKKKGLLKTLKRLISNTISRGRKSISAATEVVRESVPERNGENANVNMGGGNSSNLSGRVSSSNGVDDYSEYSMESHNLQWAQGKAGEDRVHIVISAENGWVFVGIYDGFNGPDATDYLLSNLYTNVHKELEGLLWNNRFESASTTETTEEVLPSPSSDKENYSLENGDMDLETEFYLKRKQGRSKGAVKRPEKSQRKWRCEWDRYKVELDWNSKEQLHCKSSNSDGINHSYVLKALSQALRKTEEDYLEIADKMAAENPELALMGSCVLVMLMKGEDVYLMNVGDSRAVLARKSEPNLGLGTQSRDLKIISEERMRNLGVFDGDEFYRLHNLNSIQLTMDHSTYVDKEVHRIKKEHPDDASAVMNDRVKGYLKVTRAFGVGFLKQPKCNDMLLEMFRIDYVGTSPYITCFPSLYHYRLRPRDSFLILSSDGLYQYFTNEEAVSEVESFIAAFPEGDPAQHLIEEVLFRAAKKAGMDFHELLEIPQGDRRRYHDDVSVIIISLEGRIWRSYV